MFALTVDQVDSRHRRDLVAEQAARIADRWAGRIALGPDRTAGDEFQVLARDARVALELALDLTRHGAWSVGIGVGRVDEPLPPTVREADGPALAAARDAVDAAKRAPFRAAVRGSDAAADVEGLLDLLLALRARRSDEGWAVADLLADGATQAAIAERLEVTPQAVSARATAAGIRLEQRSVPALVRLLESLDAASVAA